MQTKENYLVKNRTHDDVRRNGAIGNLNEGIEITLNQIPTRLIAWPGNGFQTESVHVLTVTPGLESSLYTYQISEEALLCMQGTRCATGDLFAAHTHPISDECMIIWAGTARGFLDNHWFEMDTHECLLAPCGVPHGGPLNVKIDVIGSSEQPKDTLWGGFASPPQGDLYLRAGYFKDQCVEDPPAVRFADIEPIK